MCVYTLFFQMYTLAGGEPLNDTVCVCIQERGKCIQNVTLIALTFNTAHCEKEISNGLSIGLSSRTMYVCVHIAYLSKFVDAHFVFTFVYRIRRDVTAHIVFMQKKCVVCLDLAHFDF